jgi:SAM-dependent methyltransferase
MTDPERYYDRHSHGYTSKWRDLDAGVFKPSYYYRHQLMATVLRMSGLTHGDRVIELGCGNGLVLREILKRTPKVFGVDVSKEMLKRVMDSTLSDRKVALVERFSDVGADGDGVDVVLKAGDLRNLDLPHGRFNRILSVEVLRYIPDVDCCLRNVSAVMGPDAVFVFTTTNLWSLSLFPAGFLLRKLLGRVDESDEVIQYFETESSIRRKVKNAGLEVVGFEKLGALFANPLTKMLIRGETSAKRIFDLDRRLVHAPLAQSLFDTFVIAARKAGGRA